MLCANQGLGLPKLNFQVLRRTMATLAQGKGSVKDIQAHPRHAKADTTANEYMQELPESVGRMVESMYEELMHDQAATSADLLPNATNADGSPTAICMKDMVGTRRLEPLTSTVSILRPMMERMTRSRSKLQRCKALCQFQPHSTWLS
jgi:hypothetical protein